MSEIEHPQLEEKDSVDNIKTMLDTEAEPLIQEDLPSKAVKKSSLLFKIDPTLEFFPSSENVSVDQMIKIKQLFNQFKFSEAETEIEALQLDRESEDVLKINLRINYWRAKANFHVGDYKKALDLANL